MALGYNTAYHSALDDFRDARRAAMVSSILQSLSRRKNRLLSFEEVRKSLKLETTSNKTYLTEIPLASIIGSVNRYQDFTRDFLPKNDSTAERWAKISAAIHQDESLPPIEVFKIGDVYFVNDGNHRVSVARQMGNTSIQAYVTEIKSRVPLHPDERPDDLIIKSEMADFLEQTRLDLLRPGADFSATAPEAYIKLAQHIAIHLYYLNVDQRTSVPPIEALLHWYDTHFLPVTNLIQESGLLREFPNKTLVDLYVWLFEHKSALEKWLGKTIDLPEAAQDIISQHGTGFDQVTSRLRDAVLPDGLEGPVPVLVKSAARNKNLPHADRLFSDILVPIDNKGERWFALEQALIIARKETARLYGLHITSEPDSPECLAMVERFAATCQKAGIAGELHLTDGETARIISHQAAWQDLITINLAYRPGDNPISRLTHGFRVIMQRSPRPVLVVPQALTEARHALLAYDGSPGAREALYVATYISGHWGTQVSILTVSEESKKKSKASIAEAVNYLQDREVQATVLTSKLPVSQAILQSAHEVEADLIIMGGFSSPPLLGILLDTIADRVLRESQIPMLLCR